MPPWNTGGQFGADPTKAGDKRTVQDLRKDLIRELKKIRIAWPELDVEVVPGGLEIRPSKPLIAPKEPGVHPPSESDILSRMSRVRLAALVVLATVLIGGGMLVFYEALSRARLVSGGIPLNSEILALLVIAPLAGILGWNIIRRLRRQLPPPLRDR